MFCAGATIKHPDNAEVGEKVLDEEIEMESTGGDAQSSAEIEADDMDSEEDNFEVMKKVIKVDMMREINLHLKLMLMKNL